ncbi:MAG: hypothetical protein IJ191_04465 [Treponema sp.]|nr:hypothetical protein [Treponema sp.]
MTIRKQFFTMLIAVMLIPLLCSLSIPLYYYLKSPKRVLMKGYRSFTKEMSPPLTKEADDTVRDALHRLPPDMEVAVITDQSQVLISTIAELPAGAAVTPGALWELISQTSTVYFYQTLSIALKDSSYDVFVVSRASFSEGKKHRRPYAALMYVPVVFLVTFSVTCIAFIMHIAKNIFSSIAVLDEMAKRIADGYLSEPLIDSAGDRRNNSNEIISLTKNLDKMRVALLDDQQRRSRFIMGVSHDLRTPIAVIKGYTEALFDDVVNNPRDVKKSLEIIDTKTTQLEAMINSLIDFVKCSSTEWQQKLVPEDVRSVVLLKNL